MLIEDVLGRTDVLGRREILTIQNQCKSFLKESGGLPVFKSLPTSYSDFKKVKVRQRKTDIVAEVFNKAFTDFSNLRQRSLFAYGERPELTETTEPFYVFPINGYRYLYCKGVNNSSEGYQQLLHTLFENFEDNEDPIELVSDVLKYTYVRKNLVEGITSDSEIIFYGIPYFYVVRVGAVSEYTDITQ